MCKCFDLFGDALDTFVETPPIAAEVLNDPDHAGRQYIDPLSQNLRELLTKEAKPLAHWNAPLQEEATDLIDHGGTLADQARSNPV